MRSGTLAIIIAANAVIAVVVVAVALMAFPPSPETGTSADSDARGGSEVAKLETEIKTLKDQIRSLEGKDQQRAKDLLALKEELAASPRTSDPDGASGESSTLAAGPTAESKPEDRAAQDAMRGMMRGMAAGARSFGRQILESLASPTEESIRQAESRMRREAGRVSRRLNLSADRAAQLEQAFLDVDRRVREKMKDTINAKGIENVTYEDAKPLVDESFQERERAAEGILSAEEMDTYKSQQAQSKAMTEMGMRMAFPAAPSSGGGGR